MISKTPDGKGGSYAFYSAQYARFDTPLAAEVRLEAYGEDFGQQGWRTIEEQNEIIALIRDQPHAHVLDIACGSGGPSLAIVLATGCRLTGVDIEPEGIMRARHRALTMGLNQQVEFMVADCTNRLPFNEGSFDVAICIDAVVHLKDRSLALADWFRLLKPGGCLIFTDAAVLTGAVSKHEIDIRASQSDFVLVPPGLNEAAILQAGFRLHKCQDTTLSTANTARRLHLAREQRSEGLKAEEGVEWYGQRQSFLKVTADLAGQTRLSRFIYIAGKPN
ncbi:type 11 methyltransferase [Labrys miyagiensis]|uniref:Type 11 methyltransferase n=1 Tax=Labrys miyagiensis TaxID=346912 RepID=A0ABQ6CJP3_9HYPH|nr:class I SAM-dependent methyltransferase [Labrys miyagiensis]GLS20582.1 type 11 methyltransferase [Labrys miyagiensis]